MQIWLRSQVEQVSNLEVKISGSDRQILNGYIPRIFISAHHVVYQGLYLSRVQLVGENILTNFRQVLLGKPLRLLEPVPVSAELLLKESDLNASLHSSLLANALTDLLKTLLPTNYPRDGLSCHKLAINSDQLIINATLASAPSKSIPVVINTSLQLASCHELQLRPQIQTHIKFPFEDIDGFKLDLGSEVDIQEITLSSGQLLCRGRINVIP